MSFASIPSAWRNFARGPTFLDRLPSVCPKRPSARRNAMTAKLFAIPWSADVSGARLACCWSVEVGGVVTVPGLAFRRALRTLLLRAFAIPVQTSYTTDKGFSKPAPARNLQASQVPLGGLAGTFLGLRAPDARPGGLAHGY